MPTREQVEIELNSFVSEGRERYLDSRNLKRNAGRTYFILWRDELCDLKAIWRRASNTPQGTPLPHSPVIAEQTMKLGLRVLHFVDNPNDNLDNSFTDAEVRTYLEYQFSCETTGWIRNHTAAVEAKRRADFKCEICEFDFQRAYGEIGKEFLEAHHNVPVGTRITATHEVHPDDFSALCSNCHRMIHRAIAAERRLVLPCDFEFHFSIKYGK